MFRLTLVLFLVTNALSQDVCNESNSDDITKFAESKNSKQVINVRGVDYSQNKYIYNPETGTYRGCRTCVNTSKICIRKCCDFGYGYHIKKKECVKIAERFHMPLTDKGKSLTGEDAEDKFSFVTGMVNCTPDAKLRIKRLTAADVLLREDGTLYTEFPQQPVPFMIFKPDRYCVDTFVFENDTGAVTVRLDALICHAEDTQEEHYVQTATCMLISCVFILATCAVYAFLPELRNLHGRVLLAYLVCLFVGFVFLATMQILILVDRNSPALCLGFTFIIYFSLLSAFFWLNVMCFDIWWTFSGNRGIALGKLTNRGRFFAYAIYAFGIPSLLTILLASLEFSGLPAHALLPMISMQGCFLSGKSKLLYLYGPIIILYCANMTFFVLTALKITQIKQQTSVLKSGESSTHDSHRKDKQRLSLYIKLFIVMGVNWILEVASACFPEAGYIWRVTDAYNVLIGVPIFIIFVFKRKIFHLLKKRYKQIRGEPMSRTTTTISSRTISRDDMNPGSIKLQTK